MDALLLILAGAATEPLPASTRRREIACYCTDRHGERVELGRSICLTVDGRSYMARCGMSLNNPAWRDTGEGCPTG